MKLVEQLDCLEVLPLIIIILGCRVLGMLTQSNTSAKPTIIMCRRLTSK